MPEGESFKANTVHCDGCAAVEKPGDGAEATETQYCVRAPRVERALRGKVLAIGTYLEWDALAGEAARRDARE